MVLRMTVGLALTVVALAVAGRRLWWLRRLAFTGQPTPDRVAAVRAHPGRDAGTQAAEVIGQRKLLKWSVPGAAHAATFWGFIVLLLTIIEAYGDLFDRRFAIPGIGHWAAIGFIEDLFAVGVLAGIITFTVIRFRSSPRREGRGSRFFGSHTRAAWVVLWMIAAVIVTLLVYRGAQQDTGVFPYPHAWAFASWVLAQILHPLGSGVNSVLEAVFILAQIGVIMAFAVIVVYSKHLHIVLAPVNVLFSRRPDALGPLEPMRSGGKVLDFEEADPDTDVFGLGKIEDFTWKGLLDLATCTECGRCQSQCPAWATGKPLSPNKGDPWGMGAARRADWIGELDFDVPVAGGTIGPDIEYLFWVGCAGALEDRAKKTTKAIATLLHTAGVRFAVLGAAETCTGDPARRIGNEFVFSMLAQQNIETLNEAAPRTIVASCPHCFNTISREYPQLGGTYEVIHHTQLLARLVEQGKLTPVTAVNEKLTYHDPCFLGRHNKVFTPPREILEAVPGVRAEEMHRCRNRGFCCGAGGARMWMEERIGTRISTDRIEEALALALPAAQQRGDGLPGQRAGAVRQLHHDRVLVQRSPDQSIVQGNLGAGVRVVYQELGRALPDAVAHAATVV